MQSCMYAPSNCWDTITKTDLVDRRNIRHRGAVLGLVVPQIESDSPGRDRRHHRGGPLRRLGAVQLGRLDRDPLRVEVVELAQDLVGVRLEDHHPLCALLWFHPAH